MRLWAVKVPEEKARAAAATVATITTNYPKPEALATKEYIEKRVAELEARIAELEGKMDSKMAELKVEIANLEGRIVGLEERINTKIAELEVRLMQQNRALARMIIAAIAVATSVIVAAIGILAVVS